MMAHPAEDFMLPAKDESDDYNFLAPARQGNKIQPLIDGATFFPAMEEAIAAAKETVYCAFWSIYPVAPLLSEKTKKTLAVKDWQGLFVKVVKNNGVKLRIILSDFDPINDNNHHQTRAWNAFNVFVANAVKAGFTKDQFQIVVSLHPDVFSDFVAAKVTKKSLTELVDRFNKNKLVGLENSPGIWQDVKIVSKSLKIGAKPSLNAFPASYHQKTIIVDNTVAFLGGANFSDYFQDTSDHLKKEPSHDIFCRIEGPAVADLERNFVGRWNKEFAGFNAFVANANANGKALGFRLDNRFAISPLSLSRTSLSKHGDAVAQLHRTISDGVSGLISYTVHTVRDDIRRAYENAISIADQFIYLENQVFRLDDLATWIINRFKANKQLQVIVVIPVVPEEIADGTADPLTFHGQALQHDVLIKLRTGLGKNLGLYSLLQKKKSAGAKLQFFGSLAIDVHSKILVVDDLFASIGSPNASPRSFQLDSEIQIGWYDPESVKGFRQDLWREHLGSAPFTGWKVGNYVQEWEAIAAKNVKAKPELRQGFVVPHDQALAAGHLDPDNVNGKKSAVPDFLT
jgi:phosphatidylserine/phosphatidylglycerophosphate/cardiolipin synthase-like enzyme